MNWDRIKGNWKQLKGKIRQRWGELTDDDLDRLQGQREELAGKIQETYGIGREEADRQLDQFADEVDKETGRQDFGSVYDAGAAGRRRQGD